MIKDLRDYLLYLSKRRRMLTVGGRVSPNLEITAFTDKEDRERRYDSRALLFKSVEGHDIPVVTNLFGSTHTMKELFADTYANEILSNLNRIKTSGTGFSLIKGGRMMLNSKPKHVESKLSSYQKLSGLDELPVLKVWPKDAGKFITLPLVITQSPRDGGYNVGIYRLQVFDSLTTGMHWQAQKGGAIHASEAHEMKKSLNVSVVVGTDPHNIIAGVAPLPPGMNEFAFAGIIRDSSTVLMKNGKYPAVPANSEIIINGHVDPDDKRKEGPFGDHTGYYSIPEKYPVLHVDAIYAKRDPVYAASVVGFPWHEDAVIAQYLFEFMKPLIKSMNESITDIHLPPEGIFTNMCFVSIKKRFPGEAKKAMFTVLGMGQLSFTKIIAVFDDDIDIRDTSQVLWALSTRIEPKRDVQILDSATADSLDHTTNFPSMGSKMLIDATKKTEAEGYSREWPETLTLPSELVKEVAKKWAGLKS